ncbi:MAG TPA: hypothetical protein VGD26_13185 [Chitinophagaceae bacterium]
MVDLDSIILGLPDANDSGAGGEVYSGDLLTLELVPNKSANKQ